MKIEFDPLVPGECEAVLKLLTGATPTTGDAPSPTASMSGNFADNAPTAPTAPVASPAPVASSEPTSPPDPADGELDELGMAHDPDIHSSPPKKTAKGIWQVRKGKKDENAAAVAAHKAAQEAAKAQSMTAGMPTAPAPTADATIPPDPFAPQTQQPAAPPDPFAPQTQQPAAPDAAAPSGMPQPTAPATPTPNTPQAPIDYTEMGKRFMAMIENKMIENYEILYSELGADYHTLATDQRAMRAITAYMDFREANHDHAAAVAQALAAHPKPAAA